MHGSAWASRAPGRFTLAGLAVGVLTLGTTAAAQCVNGYEVTAVIRGPDCGIFGNSIVVPQAINDHGDVVGYFYCNVSGADKPFLWSDGEFFALPLPEGVNQVVCNDINNEGIIVGTMGGYISPIRPFVYDDGEYVVIEVPQGAETARGNGINLGGEVVGNWWQDSQFPHERTLYWSDSALVDVDLLFGTLENEGRDINDSSQIAGEMYERLFGSRTYVLDGDSLIDLGVIPGGQSSDPSAINNIGRVAGRGILELPGDLELGVHGFYWDGSHMLDLGVPSGNEESHAYDVNDAGQVVGTLDRGRGGFFWQDGAILGLPELVDLPPDLVLKSGKAINNAGQIVAKGGQSGWGLVGIVLSPIDRPGTDINGDCVTNLKDLLFLFDEWAKADSVADVNGDNIVNTDDFLALLANWG